MQCAIFFNIKSLIKEQDRHSDIQNVYTCTASILPSLDRIFLSRSDDRFSLFFYFFTSVQQIFFMPEKNKKRKVKARNVLSLLCRTYQKEYGQCLMLEIRDKFYGPNWLKYQIHVRFYEQNMKTSTEINILAIFIRDIRLILCANMIHV